MVATTRTTILHLLRKVLRPKGLYAFIDGIVGHGKVLDVGCGNNSPYIVKSTRPDLYYVGLDIAVYNQSSDYTKYADEMVFTTPSEFHLKILDYPNTFDAVISRHNLEHCLDYQLVTLSMIQSLKLGGTIYISFPCEESVDFPPRRNTLNFYDDRTHNKPIPYSSFISFLKENYIEILFAVKRYRPVIPFLIGLLWEPFCRWKKTLAPAGGTWALYGFETVIIGEKVHH